MAQSFYLREQAERCRRLARDSADPMLRDDENNDTAVWPPARSAKGLPD